MLILSNLPVDMRNEDDIPLNSTNKSKILLSDFYDQVSSI